jgi:hypothetical protein
MCLSFPPQSNANEIDQSIEASKNMFENQDLIHWGQAKWFMHIIPATQEAEIRSIMVPGQPGQKVSKTPSQ